MRLVPTLAATWFALTAHWTRCRSGELSIPEDVIRRLHRLFCHGIDLDAAGQYRTGQVLITGTEYVPPAAEDVAACMAAFVAELPQKREKMHPIEFAVYAHRRLVDIHPFQDGNGRTARLLMNLILINQGYCIVSMILFSTHISTANKNRTVPPTAPISPSRGD